MRQHLRPLFILAFALAPLAAHAQSATPLVPPADAKLYFITPKDGERLRGPVVVRFGLQNMGVTHAGDNTPNTGHHHLLIDVTEPLSPKEPIPSDKSHLHFGGGQTETRVDLAPGTHKLQLVLGDGDHRPILSSSPIEITVLSPAKPRPHHHRPHRRYRD